MAAAVTPKAVTVPQLSCTKVMGKRMRPRPNEMTATRSAQARATAPAVTHSMKLSSRAWAILPPSPDGRSSVAILRWRRKEI